MTGRWAVWKSLVRIPVRRSTLTRTYATLAGKAEQEVTNPQTMSRVPLAQSRCYDAMLPNDEPFAMACLAIPIANLFLTFSFDLF